MFSQHEKVVILCTHKKRRFEYIYFSRRWKFSTVLHIHSSWCLSQNIRHHFSCRHFFRRVKVKSHYIFILCIFLFSLARAHGTCNHPKRMNNLNWLHQTPMPHRFIKICISFFVLCLRQPPHTHFKVIHLNGRYRPI